MKNCIFISIYIDSKGLSMGLFDKKRELLFLLDYHLPGQVSVESTMNIISKWRESKRIENIICNDNNVCGTIENKLCQEREGEELWNRKNWISVEEVKFESRKADITNLVLSINDKHLIISKDIKIAINSHLNVDEDVNNPTRNMMILANDYSSDDGYEWMREIDI